MDYQRKNINGLTLIYEKRNLPITSIIIGCKVGSGYENEKIKGISHFLEHAVFKGTKNRSQYEITKSIEKIGGTLNAFTSYNMTAFYAKVPSKHFDKTFDILSDIVQNPIFPEEEIKKERKVILEEIKMNHDDPISFLYRKVFECLYKKPFGLPIIGNKKSLLNIDRKKLIRWQKNYSKDNMIIVVIGNKDIDKVEEICKEKIITKNKYKLKEFKVEKICKNFIEKRKNLKQAHLAFSIHLPTPNNKNFYANKIINSILGVGMSSWLFQEIREKRGLAYATHSNIEYEKNFSHLLIYIGTSKENVKECNKIVEELIKKLKYLEKKDIEEAKEQVIGDFELRREDSLNSGLNILLYESFGKYEEYYKFKEKIEEVNKDNIKNALKESIGISKVFILPK
ncbi:MAG: pitrilysin family protein [Candidatus Pacearchaeota archaeon]